ncbi:hypothetical protein ABPG74_008623 [Tetrahymena malaccensis]
MMILEISGIQTGGPNRINPTLEDSRCYCFKKFFKANYIPIGLNQNNPLPQWLNCQIINGIIHIWGTPKSVDEPEVLIKIFDQLTFKILSYHLYIKDKLVQFHKKQNLKSCLKPKCKLKQAKRISKVKQIFQRLINYTKTLKQLSIAYKELISLWKKIDSPKQKLSDFKTEQDIIYGREQINSDSYQMNQFQNRKSVFQKSQFKNNNYVEPKISNQVQEIKTIDEEEEQGRDFDEANGNQMSQQIATSNYQARK